MDALIKRLPPALVMASIPFYAYHVCPVIALLAIFGGRVFIEIFHTLADHHPMVSLVTLYILGFGLLHYFKVLTETFADFMSFHKRSGFVNPDGHSKMLRVEEWRVHKQLPAWFVRVYGVLVGVLAYGLAHWALAKMLVTPGCWFGSALSIGAQSWFLATRSFSLPVWLGLEPAPHRKVGPPPSVLADSPIPRGPDGRPLDPHMWNATVFAVRIVGMLGAVLGAVLATLTHPYNMPFIEPFLVISASQAFFFTATRVFADIGDSLFDVSLHFSAFAKTLYRVTVLGAFAVAMAVFQQTVVAILVTVSFGTMIHCGLECAANHHYSYTPFVYLTAEMRALAKVKQAKKRPRRATAALLRFLGLVCVMPFVPCFFLLTLPLLGETIMRFYIFSAFGVVVVLNILGTAQIVPRRARDLIKFSLIILSGRALFYDKFGTKLRRAMDERRASDASALAALAPVSAAILAPIAEPVPADMTRKPSQSVGVAAGAAAVQPVKLVAAAAKKSKKIVFDRQAAVSILSVVVWTFVVCSQAAMLEIKHKHVASETHSLVDSDTTPGAFVLSFHLNNESMFDIGLSPRAPQSVPDAADHPFLCALGAHDTSVVELMAVSAAAYLPGEQIAPFLGRVLGRGWEMQAIDRQDDSHVSFLDVFNAARNVSIVAIRGTHATKHRDWLTDVDIWLEVAVFQSMALALPGLNIWPPEQLHLVLDAISSIRYVMNNNSTGHRDYQEPVIDYVRGIAGRRVVLTGHSLGGGLAKIVGARTGHKSVAFSGPGVLDVAKKLNISASFLFENTINVRPNRDVVSDVGTMEGTVATWQCPFDFVACHFPGVGLCHLMQLCPHALDHDCMLMPPPEPLHKAREVINSIMDFLGFG